MKKSNDTLWLVKPHPTSQFYPGSNIANDYLNSLNYDHIVKCPNYLSNETIIKIADIIVTCRGTIGLEAGIFGKKIVLGGEAYYSDLKTSLKPKNNHDYRNYLLNNKINFKLSEKQKKLCKIAFYYQIFKNSLIDSKIIPIDKFVDIDLKKSKVQHRRYSFDRVNFKSYKNFFKIVNKKIVRNDFLKDEFYIKLNTWIKNQKI